jgi:hypothetical protein
MIGSVSWAVLFDLGKSGCGLVVPPPPLSLLAGERNMAFSFFAGLCMSMMRLDEGGFRESGMLMQQYNMYMQRAR